MLFIFFGGVFKFFLLNDRTSCYLRYSTCFRFFVIYFFVGEVRMYVLATGFIPYLVSRMCVCVSFLFFLCDNDNFVVCET